MTDPFWYTYDEELDMTYICFRNERVARTQDLDGVLIDFDSEGAVLGIEIFGRLKAN